MMGLEPTTFCMASRRSSQLSYIRVRREYSDGRERPGSAARAGGGKAAETLHQTPMRLGQRRGLMKVRKSRAQGVLP